MRDNSVERLFSLFTSSDRAVAIAGDLAEERAQRGWIWFWLHVVRVALALWRNTATEAPLRVLALVLAGLALLTVPALGGVAAVFLFPHLIESPVGWIALAFFWWGGALWTGATLVALAPRRGMAACAMLAVGGDALLIGFGGPAVWFWTMGLMAAMPLLLGAAVARRRAILMNHRFLCVLCGILAVVAPCWSQQTEWKDPSPHVVKLVEVDTGVRLEVLDWGGSGPALLLLAGGGDTAHVFDDLAPTLAKRYRVVGVTRRGHPGSSAPASGYGVARLAEDIVRAMDAAGLKTPVVAGHSFAGEEMHVLGARYPTRIAGLVYVDAAFDRGDDADNEAFNAVARTLPTAPSPKAGDLASFAALRANLEKYGGAGPEAHLRARWTANADGTVKGMYTPERAIIQAMVQEMRAAFKKPYNPERIRVPAVALYAIPKSADDLIRRGSSDRLPFPELGIKSADDPAVRERIEKLFRLTRERVRKHEKWFEAFAEGGRVVELSGTHHLLISSPREVVEEIDAFMSRPARP
jgi:pimeloyl-ACP methyl ester carboxylesterase